MLSTLTKRSFAHGQVKPRVTQLLIDGKFVNSASGKTFDTFNPATEEKITSV
jgi:aldehyde dehydrogenase (NAD+)